ncbi:hemerythrin domain-containing protein [Plastorhodobacter daqingensis]|uniref:Hemerythrin domain-containing protein n=1 Tax=Plastorhodobacter daqingensis TaxID=1387281 RepID=A0ABW2UMT0_9RHOB
MDELETRKGLPEALRFLVAQYPRDIWESHRNFDALTRFWLERHMMFRQLLDRLSGDAEAFLSGDRDPKRFAAQSARLTNFLLNELHGHHQIEDHHYFPVLSGFDQRLDRGFELLDADHHALDAHLHGLAEGTNQMLRAIEAGAGRDEVGRMHEQLAGFGRFIDRHLIDEEELVIPTILHYAPRF